MKMKRKLTTLLLAVCLVATMMPATTVMATTSLDTGAALTVNGTAFVESGRVKPAATDNTVSGAAYDINTNTLTLTNYTGCEIYAWMMGDNLTIELKGNNSITGEKLGVNGAGINVGEGSLTLRLAEGSNTSVTGISNEHAMGIFAMKNLTISGGGILDITGGNSSPYNAVGLYVYGTLTVEGGRVIATAGNASGSADMSCGVYVRNSITVNGGTLEGYGGEINSGNNIVILSCGIQSIETITLSTGRIEGKGGSATSSNPETETGSYGILAASMPMNAINVIEGELKAWTEGTAKKASALRALNISNYAGAIWRSGSDAPWQQGNTYQADASHRYLEVKGSEAVAFNGVSADGSDAASTTELYLTFDKDIDSLAAEDITVTGATRGTLFKGRGTGAYTLAISDITVSDRGTVNVAVNKTGFLFTPASKDVTVRKYSTGGTYRPNKPTVTVSSDTTGEVGGTTEYDPATKTLKVIPAEGFVIEDILVNGLSVGPKGEISPIYGWDNVEVKFVKDPNAKIEAGVKGTTIKIATIKSYKYKGKDRIKLTWKKSLGFKVDYYRIYRAAGNGEFKLFYTTKTNKCTYVNTKDVKSGVKYKFKIVGVRTINGEEATTQVSKWRSAVGK